METRKENIIIIISFFLISGLLIFMNYYPAGNQDGIRIPSTFMNLKKNNPGHAEAEKSLAGNRQEDMVRSISRMWGRNPFKPAALPQTSDKTRNIPASSAVRHDHPVLTLIMISGKSRIATINNRIVHEGDTVNGERVVSIQKNGVILRKNGHSRFLTLQRKPEQVHIEKNL